MINTIFYFPDSLTFDQYLNKLDQNSDDGIASRTIVLAKQQGKIYNNGRVYGTNVSDVQQLIEQNEYDDQYVTEAIETLQRNLSNNSEAINLQGQQFTALAGRVKTIEDNGYVSEAQILTALAGEIDGSTQKSSVRNKINNLAKEASSSLFTEVYDSNHNITAQSIVDAIVNNNSARADLASHFTAGDNSMWSGVLTETDLNTATSSLYVALSNKANDNEVVKKASIIASINNSGESGVSINADKINLNGNVIASRLLAASAVIGGFTIGQNELSAGDSWNYISLSPSSGLYASSSEMVGDVGLTNSICLDADGLKTETFRTLGSTTTNQINIDGSGYLSGGALSWDAEGNLLIGVPDFGGSLTLGGTELNAKYSGSCIAASAAGCFKAYTQSGGSLNPNPHYFTIQGSQPGSYHRLSVVSSANLGEVYIGDTPNHPGKTVDLHVYGDTYLYGQTVSDSYIYTSSYFKSDNGFKKKNYNDDYVLLAGGGTKALSEFSSGSVSGAEYLPLTGGTLTGRLNINDAPVVQTNSFIQNTSTINGDDFLAVFGLQGEIRLSKKVGNVAEMLFGAYRDGSVYVNDVVSAAGFQKRNGLSTQFLKADGSVDSSTYLPTELEDINGNAFRFFSTENSYGNRGSAILQINANRVPSLALEDDADSDGDYNGVVVSAQGITFHEGDQDLAHISTDGYFDFRYLRDSDDTGAGAVSTTSIVDFFVNQASSSDETLKDKVGDVELTAEQIAEAPSIKYTWKDKEKGSKVYIGTTAQYWQDIIPEAVSEDKDGKLGLNYQGLSIAAVISLAKEVVELKAKIAELESKLTL